MFNHVSDSFWKLYRNKRLFILCLSVVAIVLFVMLYMFYSVNNRNELDKLNSNVLGSSSDQILNNTSDKTTNDSSESKAKSEPSDNKTNPTSGTATAQNLNTTKVLKSTTNSDGTTVKEVITYKSVPFSTLSQNDVNLKRGTTSVQTGQEGIETIIFSVIYGQDGKEISRKTISDEITKAAVNQITKIGVSDFNLNADTWDGTEFGNICTPADYASGSDGCIGTPSDRYFSAVSLSGSYYVYCISQSTGTCGQNAGVNLPSVIAIHGDNTFSYQGTTYRADPRAGGGGSEPLTATHCSQFGLACGRW